MKDKQLYLYWLYLFILCAALGFIQDRGPLVTALLTIAGIGFFLPPALLLYWYVLARSGSDVAATVAHAAMVIFSAPMSCMVAPALSLFLWACLLFSVFYFRKRKK